MSKVETTLEQKDIIVNVGRLIQEYLSLLIEKPVRVKINGVSTVEVTELVEKYSRNEPIVMVMTIHRSRDKELGYLILLLDISSARRLVEILADKADLELMDENAIDILKEFGNIVSGAISIVLSNSIGVEEKIEYTLPEVVMDIDTALMDSIVSAIAYKYSDSLQILDMDITCMDSTEISLKILLLGMTL